MNKTHLAPIALMLVALIFLGSGAALGEAFIIKLTNGKEFIAKYRPVEAGYDDSKVLLMTDVGNSISLPKSLLAEVIVDSEARGFGRVIDTTTIEVGVAPNTALDPNSEEAAALLERFQMQQQYAPQPQVQPVFNSPLIAEPNAGGGIPLNFVNSVTPPIGVVDPN